MLGLLVTAFLISTGAPPLDSALARSEPPASLRVAFTVEMTDGGAYRRVHFDPREPADERWQLLEAEGESKELDRAVSEWGESPAPDSWLFADDLRVSMGRIVEAEDMGNAWRVHFDHEPSENDGPVDIWAAEHLSGFAFLDPVSQRLIRVEYEAFEPFESPQGARIDEYEHAYAFQLNSKYDISYVSAFKVDVRGRFLTEELERSYRVRVTDTDFFFATPDDEDKFNRERAENQARILAAN